MITCENCHHEELSGALFCSECGAQLVVMEKSSTPSFGNSQSQSLENAGIGAKLDPNNGQFADGTEAAISLFMIDKGQIVPLVGGTEFSVGRADEGQPILPDLDLSAFEAYSSGVSRLHASLKIINQQLFITDLGSSNGTRVNGQKIQPHHDFPVNHGDIVALGKLRFQVIVRR